MSEVESQRRGSEKVSAMQQATPDGQQVGSKKIARTRMQSSKKTVLLIHRRNLQALKGYKHHLYHVPAQSISYLCSPNMLLKFQRLTLPSLETFSEYKRLLIVEDGLKPQKFWGPRFIYDGVSLGWSVDCLMDVDQTLSAMVVDATPHHQHMLNYFDLGRLVQSE